MPGCIRPATSSRRVQDVEAEVLTRQGRYRQVADNLQVKEIWVGEGERRKRYVLCFNPIEAERQRQHRAQVLACAFRPMVNIESV